MTRLYTLPQLFSILHIISSILSINGLANEREYGYEMRESLSKNSIIRIRRIDNWLMQLTSILQFLPIPCLLNLFIISIFSSNSSLLRPTIIINLRLVLTNIKNTISLDLRRRRMHYIDKEIMLRDSRIWREWRSIYFLSLLCLLNASVSFHKLNYLSLPKEIDSEIV
jgi:hypothetical protein